MFTYAPDKKINESGKFDEICNIKRTAVEGQQYSKKGGHVDKDGVKKQLLCYSYITDPYPMLF